MHSELDLCADDDAVFLVGVNVDRVTRAIMNVGLRALGAFALWVPNDRKYMDPAAVSVCSSETWTQRLAPLIATPDADRLGMALDPQTWDHPEIELPGQLDLELVNAASARLLERFGEERDPSARILEETARRIAQAPPVPADPLLVAMATDGCNTSDETLASIRYASPAASVAALEARGLPKSYEDLM
ncbi:MAG: hypothetical protein JWR63_194 [Conexibacter sp.]|nr:hypothetical protein [Conexibacter sp.]